MNILFVTEDHSFNNYGITSVLSQLANEIYIKRADISVIIASTGTHTIAQKGIPVKLFPYSKIGSSWRWSFDLRKHLEQIIDDNNIDIIHIHGLWMAIQLTSLAIAKKKQIPCVISPHGMLEQWFWKQSNFLTRLKKKIYFEKILSPQITQNAIIHAITPIEKNTIHKWFPENDVKVVPNAIAIKPTSVSRSEPERYFLFLGRLHPIKGVHLLIQAFLKANLDSQWRLVIAGPASDQRYVKSIKSAILKHNMSSQVELIGPIYGDEKWQVIQRAWAMVVPSYSEVIGMVNLEAATCRVPSITTYETGLWDWESGGGILIHPTVKALSASLIKVSKWDIEERILRGKSSQTLVMNQYSWDAILPMWVDVYANALKYGKENAKSQKTSTIG